MRSTQIIEEGIPEGSEAEEGTSSLWRNYSTTHEPPKPHTGSRTYEKGLEKLLKDFGNNVRNYRSRKQPSVNTKDLAKAVGVPEELIKDVEAGRVCISMEIAYKIARRLGREFKDFFRTS